MTQDLTHESIKGMTFHEVIGKFIEHTDFYLAQDIYPEDVEQQERQKLDRLKSLIEKQTFTADDVHFLMMEALDTEQFERGLREMEEQHRALYPEAESHELLRP